MCGHHKITVIRLLIPYIFCTLNFDLYQIMAPRLADIYMYNNTDMVQNAISIDLHTNRIPGGSAQDNLSGGYT
jgi:hypothetical protein